MLQFIASLSKTYFIDHEMYPHHSPLDYYTQIGVVAFSEEAQQVFPLNAHKNKQDVAQAILKMKPWGWPRNTDAALHKTRNSCFNSKAGDRVNVSNLAIINTYGMPSSPESTLQAAMALKEAGVTIMAIGITDDVDFTFLSKLSSAPQVFGKDYFFMKDFQELDFYEARL